MAAWQSDFAPAVILTVVTLLLGTFAAIRSPFFLTALNFRGILLLFATLAFVSLGQQVVIMTGGIDLSVGPLMGMCVIVASFFMSEAEGPSTFALGFAVIALLAVSVGAINWALIDLTGLHPVIATLVTFMALQGVALLLRPVPGGEINRDVAHALTTRIGFVPIAVIVVLVLAVLLELALRNTAWGIRIRAAGSQPVAAEDLGVRLPLVRATAYLASAALAVTAGMLLIAQVGSGVAGAGIGYTLGSIAAVVLGGTSITGGRGSFVGTLVAAFLVQELINVTVFLGLSAALEQYLLGGIILLAVGAYSRTLQGIRATR